MKSEFQSKLMECAFKALRIRSYAKTSYRRGYLNKSVIRCKRAEQTGDYKTAYMELLKVFEKHLDQFAHGHIIDGDTNHLTLIYNIPVEAAIKGQDRQLMYAIAAMYNLHKMGFPKPKEQYGWRSSYNEPYVPSCHLESFEEFIKFYTSTTCDRIPDPNKLVIVDDTPEPIELGGYNDEQD